MAWKGREATVLLLDVGSSMAVALAASESGAKLTKAAVAMRLARNLVQHKLLFTPKHEVAVVFFGSVETCNELQADGYDNVAVCRGGQLESPDFEMLRLLSAPPAGGVPSDAVNGLIVAVDLLLKRTRDSKFGAKSIHIFTDGESAAADDPDLQECVKQLGSLGARLLVTPVGAALDSGPWAQLAAASGGQVEVVPLSVATRKSSMSVKPVEIRAKVRIPLQLGPGMTIPVGVYSRTTRVSFPTLKKRSKPAAAVAEEHRKTDAVVLERTYHVADDPDGEEVKPEDRIKGHLYGQSIVPMSEYDEAALMYSCERVLCALGFAAAGSVGPEHSMQQIEAVAADRGDPWAACAFESLIDAMLAENTVLIARYCFRQNAQPRMVALMPRKGSGGIASTMEMQYLPFFEDIREWTCPSLAAPSPEQRAAVASLVDAMTLDSVGGGAAGSAAVALKAEDPATEWFRPEDTNNPALMRFYSFVVQRAMKKGAGVPPPGPESLGTCRRPAHVEARLAAEKAAERLKEKFGLVKVEKAQGKKKRFWREAIAEKRKDANFGEVDTKKIKVGLKGEKKEEDEDKVKDEFAGGEAGGGAAGADAGAALAVPVGVPPRVHVGSVHPERDFERWLAHRSSGIDAVGEAVRQMKSIIDRFAEEGDEFHPKALSCLTVLRSGCVREAEVQSFNDFARALSAAVSQRRSRFWKLAREAGVGLITDAEVPTSTVCSDEARAFLAGEPYIPASSRLSGASAGASAAASADGAAASGGGAALTEQDLEAMLE